MSDQQLLQSDPGPGVTVVPPQLDGSASPPDAPRPVLGQAAEEIAPALPGMAGAAVNVLDQARIQSAEARAIFEGRHEGDPDWLIYFDLVEERWPWRKAAYIAWCTQPRDQRQPDTEQKFAIQELGLTSARKVREWKQDDEFLGFIKDMAKSMLAGARLDIFAALVESATSGNPRNHADRKMAFEMLGDYKQTLRLGSTLPDDLDQLGESDKRAQLADLRRRSQRRASDGVD